MCRWLAYSGTPILIEDILYKPEHSLIDQSLHSRLGVETTNGDGFGIGWYGEGHDTPANFRDIGPAWNNRNLRELSGHIRSRLFCAHIRASTGTAVQQTNCHPFRYDRWLWMHNGAVNGFHLLRRELLLAVDPSLFDSVEGTTDSEVMFYLALTLGLEEDPPGAVERTVGLVEAAARARGIANPVQMTVATTDGDRLWVFRYSTQRESRSLYYSSDVDTLRTLYPDNPLLRMVSHEARIVVSEPLGDLPGVWNEVPEATYSVIQAGKDQTHPFTPQGA